MSGASPSSKCSWRLGARRLGPYVVEVRRPHPVLYRVTIAADTNGALDLATLIYRPEASR